MPTRLISIANRLPVTIGEEGKITPSSGGLVAALQGVQGHELLWIGWPGGDVPPEQQEQVQRTLQQQHGSTPVFLTEPQIEGFYEGYSNSTIWPALHYLPEYMRYQPEWWEQYQAANQAFADKVLGVAHDDDLIWVHDYQLMLLPQMLKSANPSLQIGFFLHTPFPSYEVFRCLPQREELLRGVLGADQVGFHTFGYMRHFRSAVLRLLGLESEMTRIRHGGRVTHLGVYPIGINAARFQRELESPEHRVQLRKIAEANEGLHVVLSVERLDYTKGLLRRLDGIEMFLESATDREKVKFIFISVPSRENVEAYQQLREQIESRIGRINGKYATLTNSPIRFIHGSVNFSELCALYAAADVGMVTPLIDGMNLVAKEYVACQVERPGVLILSEFAGAAEELFRALVVNPYDPEAICQALRQALEMDGEEREARMHPMRERVMRYDAQWWARTFIEDMATLPPPAEEMHGIDEAMAHLTSALSGGQKIALFLDYDGTLREIEMDPAAARPNAAIDRVLRTLVSLPNTDVTIISGRKPADLEAWLGAYPVSIIAEHGADLRRAGQGEWEQLDKNISYAWKDEILKLLRQFEASTPGSFVEQKRTSLVWHYRRADPEFGEWRAKQLTDELAVLVSNEPLHVRHGRKIVEIAADQVNKGAAIMRLLEQTPYDLILCAGDDQTDESMFRLDLRHMLSIKVGRGDTVAQYRIPTPAYFRRFLEDAAKGAAQQRPATVGVTPGAG